MTERVQGNPGAVSYDPEIPGHDERGLLDRLMVLALQDAADRTFRSLAGRPLEEVTAALLAELRVAGLEDGDVPLPGAVRYALVRAADEIAAGERPSILRRRPAAAGQRSTDR